MDSVPPLWAPGQPATFHQVQPHISGSMLAKTQVRLRQQRAPAYASALSRPTELLQLVRRLMLIF